LKTKKNTAFLQFNILNMTSKDSAETSPILKGLKSAKSGSPDNVLASKDPIRFDWENKWLKGEEYAHMLRNIDQYCS